MDFILHIETSGEICSVALSKEDNVIDVIINEEIHSHASQLTIQIYNLLKRSGINFQNLDALAVSKGPGSFTGLRIGVSTAKGICYSRDIPLIGINTLEALVQGILDSERNNLDYLGFTDDAYFCPMIDARRMEVYAALFDSNRNQINETKPVVINSETFLNILTERKMVFLGNGVDKVSKIIRHPNAIFVYNFKPVASYMAKIAWKAYQERKFEDLAYFEPYYLKDFIATVSRKNIFNRFRI